ncbi:MAG: DUF4159 domain-containing protein [Planctomycetales bacterium]|nr:DUF4159 domain-containing protein [Planctomycetales bacterium]
MPKSKRSLAVFCVIVFATFPLSADDGTNVIADPAGVGGESQSTVKVAQLIYATDKTSECFSDHFLIRAEEDSAITTSRRLHSVALSSDEVYNFPLLIMTGEGKFDLTEAERKNLRSFVEKGGFLLASASCSSKDWDASFRREMAKVFAEIDMQPLTMDHLIFHTVYDINKLTAKNNAIKPLEGIHLGNRVGVLYSQDGLNDTSHTEGCCCCGGNEITNSEMVNVNILVYSLLH